MIKLIIFDIGGVIEDFAEEQYIDYICTKLKLDKKEFREELLRILPSAEEGRISTREMLQRVAIIFGINIRKLEWSSSLVRLAKINPRMEGLVNKLDEKYRLVLLTNVSKSRYMENVRMGFFSRVRCDRVYASCYLKMSKPGQEIYRYVLDREGVKPQEAVFIDNLLINVKGARKIGIKGVHFVGYGKLVKDLRKLGIRW
ncbi:MAG: HAD family phosphatase [Candidatus Micrarchaeota archaeon]|nr:HAD family phosphatase [Candidatus Micrarchaeota archaeon]